MIYVYIVYIVYACVPVYHVLLRILPEILRREVLPPPKKSIERAPKKSTKSTVKPSDLFCIPKPNHHTLYIYIAMCFSQCQVGL